MNILKFVIFILLFHGQSALEVRFPAKTNIKQEVLSLPFVVFVVFCIIIAFVFALIPMIAITLIRLGVASASTLTSGASSAASA